MFIKPYCNDVKKKRKYSKKKNINNNLKIIEKSVVLSHHRLDGSSYLPRFKR